MFNDDQKFEKDKLSEQQQQHVVEDLQERLYKSMLTDFEYSQVHLNSYNNLPEQLKSVLCHQLQNKLEYIKDDPIEGRIHFAIKFVDVKMGKPLLKDDLGIKHAFHPKEAILREMDYVLPMFVDVVLLKNNTTLVQYFSNHVLCYFPIMQGSILDPYANQTNEIDYSVNPGGQFIIGGHYRIIPPTKYISSNQAIISLPKTKEQALYLYDLEVRSQHESTPTRSTSTINFYITTERKQFPERSLQFVAHIPNIKNNIPVGILCWALGINPFTELQMWIQLVSKKHWYPDKFIPWLQDLASKCSSKSVYSQQDAIIYMVRESHRCSEKSSLAELLATGAKMLKNDVLPHLEIKSETWSKKFGQLGYYKYIADRIWDLLMVVNNLKPIDDKDDITFNEYTSVGPKILKLFRGKVGDLLKESKHLFRAAIEKGFPLNLTHVLIERKLTMKLRYAMNGTGWTTNNQGNMVTDVSQFVNEINPLGKYDHLMLVGIPVSSSGQFLDLRNGRPTNFGRICFQTPDNEHCGLKNYRVIGCKWSQESKAWDLFQVLYDLYFSYTNRDFSRWGTKNPVMEGLHWIQLDEIHKLTPDMYDIEIGGIPFGWTSTPHQWIKWIKHLRTTLCIASELSIWYNDTYGNIRIKTNRDLIYRPLINLERVQLNSNDNNEDLNWNQCIENGWIDYVEANEETNLMVALNWEQVLWGQKYGLVFTHLELHPNAISGLGVSLCPYANYNSCNRVSFASIMSHHNVMPTRSIENFNTMGWHLMYPQRPISQTLVGRTHPLLFQTNVMNANVMICSYDGHNQEDAVLLSRTFADHGGWLVLFDKVYRDQRKRIRRVTSSLSNQSDRYEIPTIENCQDLRYGVNYNKLSPIDAMVPMYSYIQDGDALIGKTTAIRNNPSKKGKRRCRSIIYRGPPGIVVGKVITIKDPHGKDQEVRKIMIRSLATVETGDKNASRHGQKGVVGFTVSPEDMPFTADGVIPDIIMGIHSVGSRMTVVFMLFAGQSAEAFINQAALADLKFYDSSPYRKHDIQLIQQILQDRADNPGQCTKWGKVEVRNGMTGNVMDGLVSFGLIGTKRMKQFSAHKIQARSIGPIQPSTRQPPGGKKHQGGLANGEMEKDVFNSYGSAATLLEMYNTKSDKFDIFICSKCRNNARWDFHQKTSYCDYCQTNGFVFWISSTYALRTISYIIFSMGMEMKFTVEEY